LCWMCVLNVRQLFHTCPDQYLCCALLMNLFNSKFLLTNCLLVLCLLFFTQKCLAQKELYLLLCSFILSVFLSFCISVFLYFCLSVFLSFCISVFLNEYSFLPGSNIVLVCCFSILWFS
jgi:RsiW-degrading membrane proteinase PrsW (M82 family)